MPTPTPHECPAAEFDLTQRSLYQGGVPHDLFTELRSAGAVHRHPPAVSPHGEEVSFWSVVRHEEVQAASRDRETFTAVDGPGIVPTSTYRDSGMIVAKDGPEHVRLRRLISSGFTPRMVARLESAMEERAERILDAAIAKDGGLVDFVSDVAFPLPMHVIADIVGIPEEDRAWVFSRTDEILRSLDPATGLDESEQFALQFEFYEYAQRLTAAKRENPVDDIWSVLAMAEVFGDDRSPSNLTVPELDAFFMVLAVAGSETTRNTLSQGLLELLRHPDQVDALRSDPSLLPGAVDEVLRWASPVLMFGRTATRDVELGDQTIAAGDRIVMWFPSANRDERAFADPFRFDITRDPNPHVSFGGGGAHYCLGANLARKEIHVMLGALLRRFSTIEIVGAGRWECAGPVHNVGVSLEYLPVHLGEAGHFDRGHVLKNC